MILISITLVGCSKPKVQPDEVSLPVADANGIKDAEEGMPFGKITESDTDQLLQFAKEKGFDLSSDLQKASAKDALARFFRFSLTFKSFDRNARTYGHVVYCSLLNLGETLGIEEYFCPVLVLQDAAVQQRVRDFLYVACTRVPEEQRAEALKEVQADFPHLFPTDYKFGRDDPLFKK